MNRKKEEEKEEKKETIKKQTLHYCLHFGKKLCCSLYYLSCSANNTDIQTCTEQCVLNDKFTNSNLDPVCL